MSAYSKKECCVDLRLCADGFPEVLLLKIAIEEDEK